MDAQESVAGPCGQGRLFLRAAPRGGCSSWRSHQQRFFPLELAKPWTFWAVNAVPSCPAALPSGVANTCSLCRSWFQAAGGPKSPEFTVFSRRFVSRRRWREQGGSLRLSSAGGPRPLCASANPHGHLQESVWDAGCHLRGTAATGARPPTSPRVCV
ncbi:uncharacterized protein LOC121020028 isoform X5 [Herpailurus yagouaroundi]|uniref:uncharacterized protein LOC121020028 isoform X5 n=1 Tax=Herpailurus yagouaroundi TaxID=1608482 RepID=UPI001AD718C3|nr:uncharacterized protein LOC121020028 isoform X5 [Puma yagouaroundi]